MPSQVRVGVIGTSWWTAAGHLPCLKSHDGAKLVAICGRNRARAEGLAAKCEIPRVFTDYREMIEKAGLDAIVIITPDDLHYPMTMDALDAGLHVLCEKPLAGTAAEAREMYEKAEAAGVKHMTYFTYRWFPHYAHLKALIDQGYIGRCLHCSTTYLAGFARGSHYAWRYDRNRANGALGDLGSHMIDLARWYVGEIEEVSAGMEVFCERTTLEGEPLDSANDAAMSTVKFANGALGTIQVSSVAHVGSRGQQHQILLHGEDGALELNASTSDGAEIRGARRGEDEYQTLQIPDSLWGHLGETAPYLGRILDVFTTQSVGDRLFIDSILENRTVTPSFYDGLKAQEVIDAALQSHETGRWMSVGQPQA
jgi:predicted dehydrogenase